MQKIPVYEYDPHQKSGKIYVRLTEGLFQNLRRLISGSLMLMFFATAWINFDGQQIVLFDFFNRRIHLFGLLLSPKDLFLLAGMMIFGATLLFAMAMAYSRVWCGFACPQSIWTWVFIRIEDLTEGSRNNRIKADRNMRGMNLARRILKHILWLLFATLTAVTFIGYFTPIREIATDIMQLNVSAELAGWIIIFALLTYVNAGLTREKVCLHMCPYSRFQSVMFDEDTRTVSYDATRGEPRRTERKESAAEGRGDCIDCKLCIHVCPTGIDIREGLQADCLACGACIDVCDQVMIKTKKPTGLIRFKSANAEAGQASAVWRPRLAGYMTVMTAMAVGLGWGFMDRDAVLIDISRDRQNLYQVDNRGLICNDYQLAVENVYLDQQALSIAVADTQYSLSGPQQIQLPLGQRGEYQLRVCRQDDANPSPAVQFMISSSDQKWLADTTFIDPAGMH